MSKIYVDSIASKTGAADALSISSTGIVTHPSKPIAVIGQSGDQTYTVGDNFPKGTPTVYADVNGDWSSATKQFTCPVSGLYKISIFFIWTPANASIGFKVNKNGVTDTYLHHNNAGITSGTSWTNYAGMTIISCSANDTLELETDYASRILGNEYARLIFELVG